jgi:hypothetical protein
MLTRLACLANRIYCKAQQFGLILFRDLGNRLAIPLLAGGLHILLDSRYLLTRLGFVQHPRIDLECLLWHAQFVDSDLAAVEGVLDACRCLGPVGHGDHHGRDLEAHLRPALGRL